MNSYLRRILTGIVFIGWIGTATGQQKQAGSVPAPAKPALRAGLTVEEVCKLAQAGLSEDLILALVRKNGKAFQLTTPQVLQLKQAAVSDAVIKVMLDPAAEVQPGTVLVPPELPRDTPATPSPAVVVAAPVAAASTPAAHAPAEVITPAGTGRVPEENGIYWLKDGRELVRIEGKALSNIRTGNMLTHSLTLGVKRMRINAQLRGPRAESRIREKQPRFYLYLPEDASAGDYLLLRLVQRSDVRQLEVGQSRFFKSQAGVDQSSEVDFSVERVKPRLYLVTPKTALEAGEYGFYPAAGASEMKKPSGRIYDFGVDPS
ncbi:MAG: hypothetical protein HY820_16360 [Acidobacteria bacterium]|nr:hypothetical protein [Acidobacteriota bacterium]